MTPPIDQKFHIEFTSRQIENLKALVMDANIKGEAAYTIVELLNCLNNPVVKEPGSDLHSEHNDGKEHGKDQSQENTN